MDIRSGPVYRKKTEVHICQNIIPEKTAWIVVITKHIFYRDTTAQHVRPWSTLKNLVAGGFRLWADGCTAAPHIAGHGRCGSTNMVNTLLLANATQTKERINHPQNIVQKTSVAPKDSRLVKTNTRNCTGGRFDPWIQVQSRDECGTRFTIVQVLVPQGLEGTNQH